MKQKTTNFKDNKPEYFNSICSNSFVMVKAWVAVQKLTDSVKTDELNATTIDTTT